MTEFYIVASDVQSIHMFDFSYLVTWIHYIPSTGLSNNSVFMIVTSK